jgi:hypothetical protein
MNKRRISFIWFPFIVLLLVGCKSTSEKEAETNRANKEFYEVLEAAEKYTKAREKIFLKPTNLNVWIQMVHYKFERIFVATDAMNGHTVKLGVVLDDNGLIENIKLNSSSGSVELFDAARKALETASPFPVSGLSEHDKKRAQDVILVFSPKK